MHALQEVLTINVQPGWKDGTRITFAGKGDELPGQPPQVQGLPLSFHIGWHLLSVSQHFLPWQCGLALSQKKRHGTSAWLVQRHSWLALNSAEMQRMGSEGVPDASGA